ncbi:MAG: 50S ribosomal protein L6 [Candidatus Woykebacteria bacterium]
MSKIGKQPIKKPENIQIELGQRVMVKGPRGELSLKLPHLIEVEEKDGTLVVVRKNESKEAKSLHGLIRTLIFNLIKGVTEGFQKSLELSGIGFRANLVGDKLVLSVGYSHQVEIEPPAGITFAVTGNKITVSGIDKELVGRMAAEIRNVRRPDPYKGKGIRYEGEVIRLKPGKSVKAGVGTGS